MSSKSSSCFLALAASSRALPPSFKCELPPLRHRFPFRSYPTRKTLDTKILAKSQETTGWNLVPNFSLDDVKISKSDEEFAAEGIEFVDGYNGIDLEELNELFAHVNFLRRNPDRLKLALENTYLVLWIRYTRSSRFAKKGQILGFARVLSDGEFYASIWDVAVFPSWQKMGLGRALIERLLVRLVNDKIPVITLYAEREVIGLYEKLGFKKDAKGVTGMAYALK